MTLPVIAYGHPTLRKAAIEIDENYPQLASFLADLWDTMYDSNGVGIAAPQVNKSIRVFVVDTIQIVEGFDAEDLKQYPNEAPIKSVFINPKIISIDGEEWSYNEGCLSIPKVREDVKRQQSITMTYLDENFVQHESIFSGITARVILHEYDHLDGKLFIDYLPPLKRRLLRKKLEDISNGKVKTDYRMVFAQR